jgi:hypothetical protein
LLRLAGTADQCGGHGDTEDPGHNAFHAPLLSSRSGELQ